MRSTTSLAVGIALFPTSTDLENFVGAILYFEREDLVGEVDCSARVLIVFGTFRSRAKA